MDGNNKLKLDELVITLHDPNIETQRDVRDVEKFDSMQFHRRILGSCGSKSKALHIIAKLRANHSCQHTVLAGLPLQQEIAKDHDQAQ